MAPTKSKEIIWSIKLFCYKCNKKTNHETVIDPTSVNSLKHKCRICNTKRTIRK